MYKIKNLTLVRIKPNIMTKLFIILMIITFTKSATGQWTTLTTGTTDDINSIYFTNVDSGFAVSSSGTIFKTTDGGVNWSQSTFGTHERFKEIYFTNDTIGFIVGDTTFIRTIDGGSNWAPLPTISSGNGILFVNDTIGYSWTYSTLHKSIDAGTTWVQQSSVGHKSIYFVDENLGYSVKGSLIQKTINGGINWSQQISGTSLPLNDIYFTDANTGYAVGGGAVLIPSNQQWESIILKTIDGGANWAQQYWYTPGLLESVIFTSQDTGYAVGGLDGTILKTIDAGTNWISQSIPQVDYLNTVHFVNMNVGYAAGRNDGILKTINGSVNIDEETSRRNLVIYPNPTLYQLRIDTELNLSEISIIDLAGKTIKSIQQNTNTINVADLPSGIYFIKIITEETIITKKFVKH
jgi:photosystem II stability/assembly factor-like uncharacterized protein